MTGDFLHIGYNMCGEQDNSILPQPGDQFAKVAALKGLSRSHAKRKAKELLELVSLKDAGKKKIKVLPAPFAPSRPLMPSVSRRSTLSTARLSSYCFVSRWTFCSIWQR